jgi:hypothetical protein
MTSLWEESKLRMSKVFVISMGATVLLTAVISVVILTGNYSINAQMTGDHGGWVGNMTSGVKDHQQEMIINGTISLEQTIFEAINSKINTSLAQAMTTAERSVGNDAFAVAAFGSEEDGYFAYRIILATPGMKFYWVKVDPGNGQILETQRVSQKELDKMHYEHSAMVTSKGGGGEEAGVRGFPFIIPH